MDEVLEEVLKKILRWIIEDLVKSLKEIGKEKRIEKRKRFEEVFGKLIKGLVGIGMEKLLREEEWMEGGENIVLEKEEEIKKKKSSLKELMEIGVEIVRIDFRNEVIGGEDELGIEGKSRKMILEGKRKRVDIERIGIVWRKGEDWRNEEIFNKRIEEIVVKSRSGSGGILRIEREYKNKIEEMMKKEVGYDIDGRMEIENRKVKKEIGLVDKWFGKFIEMRESIGEKGRLIIIVIKDEIIENEGKNGKCVEKNKVKDRVKDKERKLDEEEVGEKLGKIEKNREVDSEVRSEEIEKKKKEFRKFGRCMKRGMRCMDEVKKKIVS